ncbi:MAG TPA: helix-turn-helix domain-containing protein [Candidatus Lustribacter sp.]|nr:helix-turn-helix domain-containing protein [Candidatus Lustribacter sp.]
MATPRQQASDATLRNVERSAGELSTAAIRKMETSHDWFRTLPPEERSWVGLVAQAGIGAFITWFRGHGGDGPVTASVFGTAPRELTRSVSLGQTLDLVRSVVDVVEEQVSALAAPGDEVVVREAILRYSREIAFAAAEVYAGAAEARGAWDARLEALVVDAVLRGEADDSMQSRATALGWGSVASVTVAAGAASETDTNSAVDTFRKAAARHGVEALAAVQRHRLVVIIGGTTTPMRVLTSLLSHFGEGPVVLGPTVPHLFAAGRSARAALSGLGAAAAWPEAPRPVYADDLITERVLAGDVHAQRALISRVFQALEGNPSLLDTASVFLDTGSLEGTARMLFVHPNTVRYRLGRISEITGYDLTHPRCVGLALGRLARPAPTSWRAGVPGRSRTGSEEL